MTGFIAVNLIPYRTGRFNKVILHHLAQPFHFFRVGLAKIGKITTKHSPTYAFINGFTATEKLIEIQQCLVGGTKSFLLKSRRCLKPNLKFNINKKTHSFLWASLSTVQSCYEIWIKSDNSNERNCKFKRRAMKETRRVVRTRRAFT